MMFPCQRVASVISLKIKQLEVSCETKTKDNVFVKVVVEGIGRAVPTFILAIILEYFFTVQYKVIEDKVPSAYYKLSDPSNQIRSYVYDVVRSSIPRLELDSVFASKDEIANAVRMEKAFPSESNAILGEESALGAHDRIRLRNCRCTCDGFGSECACEGVYERYHGYNDLLALAREQLLPLVTVNNNHDTISSSIATPRGGE